ncbi:DUF5682 family protein [Saccharothrix sp. MB29]|nr:DUF5682 family protein [Saccharothrix sp. MB29]
MAVRLHRAVSGTGARGRGDGVRGRVPARVGGAADGGPRLFAVVDEWLTGLSGADFEAAVPLLRRAVAEFSPPSGDARDRVRRRQARAPAGVGDRTGRGGGRAARGARPGTPLGVAG